MRWLLLIGGGWLSLDLALLVLWVGAVNLAGWRASRRQPFFPICDESLRGFQRELSEWDGRLPGWLEAEARGGGRS